MGNCHNCGDSKDEANLSIHQDASNGIQPISSQLEAFQQTSRGQDARMVLEVKTWQKESYSLYDYENKTHVKETSFQVGDDGYLLCKSNDILWRVGSTLKKDDNETVLIQLEKIATNFQLVNLRYFKPSNYPETNHDEIGKIDMSTLRQQEEISAERPASMNESLVAIERYQHCLSNGQKQQTQVVEKGSKIWLVVRSVQQYSVNQGFKLVEGDTIKLGRVKLIVKEIHLVDYSQNSRIENDIIENSSQQSVILDRDSIQCRVCLSVQNQPGNPLINPCKCSGSTKYIHLLCLQTWLRQKLHSRCSDDCTVLLWKNLECELCKFIYPPVFKSDGNTYDLVELSKPKGVPYMMLEFFQKKYQERDNRELYDNSNGMYIIFFGKKKSLRLGRAHDLEVNINDISVSRMHANLKQVGNDVYIQDKKSKFGTLVLLQKNIELYPELCGLEVQVGRNLIEFQLPNPQPNNRPNFEKLLGREPSSNHAQ